MRRKCLLCSENHYTQDHPQLVDMDAVFDDVFTRARLWSELNFPDEIVSAVKGKDLDGSGYMYISLSGIHISLKHVRRTADLPETIVISREGYHCPLRSVTVTENDHKDTVDLLLKNFIRSLEGLKS